MNYIVFDLEFNQGYNFGVEPKTITNPKCPFEIIQIGAIKLNENLERIGALDVLIKPEIYTTLNPFVKELTGITMDELNSGKSFKEMYGELIDFMNTDKSVLCVWGVADIKELFRNIEYHELDATMVPTEYINIQSYASKELNCQKGINIGLGNASKLLGIPIESQFHDAFNDAFYTAEVFKKIYSSEIKAKVYNPYKQTRLNRSTTENYKIDFCNLMNQFEKMYKREMTQEEKSIIKLAYIMGKTNQFQIKVPQSPNK
ncbi:exonuclease domain-containing protein [Clostridium estertheticum]|uniref:3'-5' exonuclease n=1 Tax=Clostridium estertheticum TaxID=238834 RepID=UPI0013E92D44|nr:3'-5' exonuclease [Clostridium estertheticum]MBZ9684998.1 exonuclease domain-containing protein [Clostridium estertheticum]